MKFAKHVCPYDKLYCSLKRKYDAASFNSSFAEALSRHSMGLLFDTDHESAVCPLDIDDITICKRYVNYVYKQETR